MKLLATAYNDVEPTPEAVLSHVSPKSHLDYGTELLADEIINLYAVAEIPVCTQLEIYYAAELFASDDIDVPDLVEVMNKVFYDNRPVWTERLMTTAIDEIAANKAIRLPSCLEVSQHIVSRVQNGQEFNLEAIVAEVNSDMLAGLGFVGKTEFSELAPVRQRSLSENAERRQADLIEQQSFINASHEKEVNFFTNFISKLNTELEELGEKYQTLRSDINKMRADIRMGTYTLFSLAEGMTDELKPDYLMLVNQLIDDSSRAVTLGMEPEAPFVSGLKRIVSFLNDNWLFAQLIELNEQVRKIEVANDRLNRLVAQANTCNEIIYCKEILVVSTTNKLNKIHEGNAILSKDIEEQIALNNQRLDVQREMRAILAGFGALGLDTSSLATGYEQIEEQLNTQYEDKEEYEVRQSLRVPLHAVEALAGKDGKTLALAEVVNRLGKLKVLTSLQEILGRVVEQRESDDIETSLAHYTVLSFYSTLLPMPYKLSKILASTDDEHNALRANFARARQLLDQLELSNTEQDFIAEILLDRTLTAYDSSMATQDDFPIDRLLAEENYGHLVEEYSEICQKRDPHKRALFRNLIRVLANLLRDGLCEKQVTATFLERFFLDWIVTDWSGDEADQEELDAEEQAARAFWESSDMPLGTTEDRTFAASKFHSDFTKKGPQYNLEYRKGTGNHYAIFYLDPDTQEEFRVHNMASTPESGYFYLGKTLSRIYKRLRKGSIPVVIKYRMMVAVQQTFNSICGKDLVTLIN